MANELATWKNPGCRIVCRPDRKEPRKWTLKDLQRVAGYVERGGISPLVILAAIIVVTGFGALICAAAPRLRRFLDWYIRFRALILRPTILITFITAVRRVIALLQRIGILVPPPLRAALVALLSGLTLLLGALTGLSEVDEDVRELQAFVARVDDLCVEIKNLGGLL